MIRLLLIALIFSYGASSLWAQSKVRVGADHINEIVFRTKDKRVGIATNHTGILSDAAKTFLIDTLLSRGVDIRMIFTPEHGLRGDVDAGAHIASGRDPQSGLPVVSLYGKDKKPKPTQLQGIDMMLFDMQDVGVRFYTYISTLYYIMEACAEQGVSLLLLDRPNPHDTIDGAVMNNEKYRSFVSLLPIPTVHGLTLGEAALMINGEKWLRDGLQANLSILPVEGWRHGEPYSLPVPPSPNLRSDRAIALYPTLCYIEGTSWSEGRGTDAPFEQIGYPNRKCGPHTFVPKSRKGASSPKHSGKKCYGPDLSRWDFTLGINVELLIEVYKTSREHKIKFITNPRMFDRLAGNGTLRQQIMSGKSASEIRASWSRDLLRYRKVRSHYLLYPDYSYSH